jgi:hypothetical protein
MIKKITHTWHYHLAQADNSFSLYFNDRLIAIILKPSSGRWPVHATINEKMYSFSKTGLLPHSIKVADAMTGEAIGVIKMPLLPSMFATTKFVFNTGEEFTWYSNNFFSLHWKWKKGNESMVDAIDNLAAKKNNGIIAINEYKAGTDLLIIAGFFLSLLKRSKLSMGIKGLKRRRVGFSKQHA